jgi:hypothetical protein
MQTAADGLKDNSTWFYSVLRNLTDDHRTMCAEVNASKTESEKGVW